jgi:predicted nucleotidyltransferase
MKLDRILGRLTALIVRTCDPERIVLFGSCVKGLENVDSDLDILVIGDFNGSPFLRAAELRQLTIAYPIRVDLHLVTPREVDAESRKPFGFLASVLASGKTLYLRNENPTELLAGHSVSLTCAIRGAKSRSFGET